MDYIILLYQDLYHCAPYIHKYLDDEKYLGTVRISLGQYNKKNDIDQLIDAISEL